MLAKKFYAQRYNNAPSYNNSSVSKSSSFRLNKLRENIVKSNFKIVPENNINNYIKEKEASRLNCIDVNEKSTTTSEKIVSKGTGCNIFKPVLSMRFTNDYILRKNCVLPKELQKPKIINNICKHNC